MNTPTKQPASLYYIVVSHYLLSALFFLALAGMFLASINDLTGHYFHPKILALTHMAALGWGSLVIFGACYQLLPVIFEVNLYSYRLPWVSLVTFVAGVLLLVWSFWVFDPGIYMQAGGVLLLFAILVFSLNVFLTARRNRRQIIQQEFILTSCIWLIATAVLGLLLVFNFRYAFLPKDHLQFLKLHAHMGIAGWFLLLIIGVSAKLIPMFLVSTVQKSKLLQWSYYLINIALLLFLVDGYIAGVNFRTFFVLLLALAGLILYFVFVWYCFSSRLKSQIDLPILNTIVSIALLSVSVIVLPLIIYFHVRQDPLAVQYTGLYGTLLFMGWISSLILGQTFKTLPFVVWVKKYQHLSGKAKIPMPAQLFNNKLLKAQTWTFLLFAFTFYPGYVLHLDTLLYAGGVCILLTALFYLINVLTVLFHQTKILKS